MLKTKTMNHAPTPLRIEELMDALKSLVLRLQGHPYSDVENLREFQKAKQALAKAEVKAEGKE